jgi:hypothetical protein
VDDYVENGAPVNVIIGFELPQKDEVATTRTLTDKDEHSISDFYLLIFNGEGNRIFGKYYSNDELRDKVSYAGGNWSSAEKDTGSGYEYDEGANSTHGWVIAKAVTGTCYVFGFANIGAATDEVMTPVNSLEGAAVVRNLYEGITSSRYKLDHVMSLDDLYEVQIDAMSDAKDNILVRESPNLMYSGAWRQFGAGLVQDKSAGQVTIKSSSNSEGLGIFDPESGNIDLRGAGMIHLRTLTSHVKFRINVNNEVFSAFEPESWQVINLPKRVYLMDQRLVTNPPVERAEIDFKASTVMKNQMVHEDGFYTFDFWMYENHKTAREITEDDEPENSLDKSLKYARKDQEYVSATNKTAYSDAYFDDGDEVDDVKEHYRVRFGKTLTQWEVSNGVPLPWLKTVYGYGSYNENKHQNYGYFKDKTTPLTNDDKNAIDEDAKKQFIYSKRELQVKRYTKNNQPVWNRTGDYYPYTPAGEEYPSYPSEKNDYTKMQYDSKKFLYADDKATYVIIKGRLRFNVDSENVTLTNLAGNYDDIHEGDYLTPAPETFTDGYVDVTYTIHLGDLNKGFDNFDCLRNTEYIYNVTINNVNSIYTTIQTSDADINNGDIRVKKQHGADGLMNMAKGTVYNTDAHFCQFNMMLTKEALNNFFFEMNTPWNNFSTEDFYVTVNTVDEEGNSVKEKRFIYLDRITKHKTSLSGGYVNDYTIQDQNRIRQIVTNPDFTWFKFAPNVDQRGMFDTDEPPSYYFTNHKDDYNKVRQTEKYNRALAGITLWNLYEFTLTMESLVAAEKAATPTATSEASVASAKARIDNLLAQRFDCTVGDYGSYTGTTALPFMLDKVEYKVSTAVKESIERHIDPGNVNYDPALYACQTISETANSDGTWTITEDYAKYLKALPGSPFSDKTLAPIRRMFYTVYLDEYYYYEQPYGVSSWVRPYWKHFANQPSRYVNFGYRGADYTGEGLNEAGFKMSSDGQSGIMVTQLTIVQPSIQTFYSTESINTDEKYEVAIGLEHVNETHDPRWKDELDTPATSEMDRYNGWQFTWDNLNKTPGTTNSWDNYVGKEVYDAENGFQNNVIMKSATGYTNLNNNRPTDETRRTSSAASEISNPDNPYVAGAVRMCMNRNRDENGNGKIDESELKWFLPTSRQYELAAMGHYSLQDPLFDYNTIVKNSSNGRQRLPQEKLNGKYLFKYHYVASDYHVLLSEEMANSPFYGIDADYMSRPYEMRCTRNLGGEYDKHGSIIEDGSYDLPAPYNYVSKTSQSLLFKFNPNTKIFEMTYYDRRSVRGLLYDAEILPEHFMFSTTNLPYYRFKVAKNLHYIELSSTPNYDYLFLTLKPCYNYTEEVGGADLHSWRTPNHAELAFMVTQLRQSNYERNKKEKVIKEFADPAWFFTYNTDEFDAGGSLKRQIYSTTTWNFTGTLNDNGHITNWVRVHTVNYNKDEGWGIHTTNPTNTSNGPNVDFYPNEGEKPKNKAYVRCVKDVRGDRVNYKEFGSDSENYGQSYGGSDSEGFN